MALHVGSSPATNIEDNLLTWTAYDWSKLGDEWSNNFGGSLSLWFGIILPRICRFHPAEHVLGIAPVHGRCTRFLVPQARQLTLVDLVPKCIERCKKRFGEGPSNRYVVNDGQSLPGTADQSVDFVFSWDSLVHVDRDPIRNYLFEIARVLRPGGHTFLHHSNLGMQFAELSAQEKLEAFGNRRPSVASDSREAGLWCVAQELIPQSKAGIFNDCYTLLKNEPAKREVEPVIKKRTNWNDEIVLAREAVRFYSER